MTHGQGGSIDVGLLADAIAEEGGDTDAVLAAAGDMPEIADWLLPIQETFNMLSPSRSMHASGPNPLQLSEIINAKNYLLESWDLREVIFLIQALDETYLTIIYERQKQEQERQRKGVRR